MADYYVIPTNIGEAKMTNALALGIPIAITELAVGDGEGNGARGTPIPNPEANALISERRRAPLNSFSVDPDNGNIIIAEQVIPETAGGWWIREMGLFDEDGDMIFVCNTPPTYKPELSEGSGRTQVVRMASIVSDTAAVTLKVDPSIVIATRKYTQDAIGEHSEEFQSKINERVICVEGVANISNKNLDIGKALISIKPQGNIALDSEFAALETYAKNTGQTVVLGPGNYRITKPFTIEGFRLELMDGAEIEVFGDDSSSYVTGGVIVGHDGVLSGGVVYTNGTMTAGFDNKSPVDINGGRVINFTKVYSQLYACVRQRKPSDCQIICIGGGFRGYELRTSVDEPCNLDIRYFNVGTYYVNKVNQETHPSDSRACHIVGEATINSRWSVNVEGYYSYKNGLWVQSADPETQSINDLYLTGRVYKAGFFLDAANAEQIGLGAGTCIEVLACPDAVIDMHSEWAEGYNVAIAANSHRARLIGGSHVGNGGDPNVVVASSDNVVIKSSLRRGTVCVSVGEDGATANNTLIEGSLLESASFSPVRFTSGKGLKIINSSFVGAPTSTSAIGGWSGYGKFYPAVTVYGDANDIEIDGNTFSGNFTHDVAELRSSGNLRVSRGKNNYACPIVAREDIQYRPLHRDIEGARVLAPVTDSADTNGHIGYGEITILATDTNQYVALNINPALADLTAIASPEDLTEALKNYKILFYVKYNPDANGEQLRFGLTDTFNVSQGNNSLFLVFGDGTAEPGDNNIAGKFHPLQEGEWWPVWIDLDDACYSTADKSNMKYFILRKFSNPTTYDLTVTNPVLVHFRDW